MTIRLSERSIVYGTRSKKRFTIFVVAFILLSLVTVMSINSLNTESEEFLLGEKAIVLKQNDWNTASEAAFSGDVETLGDAYGTAVTIKYFRIEIGGTRVHIFSTPPNSWANPLVTPILMTEGRYVSYREEAIISDNLVLQINPSSPVINQSLEVGSYIKFNPGTNDEINLFVSGKFDPGVNLDSFDPLSEGWIFVHEDTFEDLVDNIAGITVYYYSVTYVANGATMLSGFLGNAYKNIDNIYNEVESFAATNNAAWDQPEKPNIPAQESNSQLKEILFYIGVFGGMIASSLYAYLISRFRRREVAVLKALGYSNNNIRIVLLAEIITVTLIGFFIGLVLLQLYMIFNSTNSSYTPNLFNEVTTWISFAIVALSNVIAFLIISTRTKQVKTMELFRGA